MPNTNLARILASLLILLSLAASPEGTARALPAGPSPNSIDPDPIIQGMIDQVTTEDIYQYDKELAGELPVWVGGAWYTISTRYTYSGEPIQKATHYIGEQLANLGLEVEYHVWDNPTNPNVIGELPGLTNPDEIYIIGGHLDAVQGTPGADDDASGSVGALIAAEILTQYQWGCTLRFAFWTGEEQWMLGSEAYADRSAQLGENIQGYLNLDMIAWNTLGSEPEIDLMYRPDMPPTLELAQLMGDVIDAYNLDLIAEIRPDGGQGSDQEPFWDNGYTAILAIEDHNEDFNPYYHEAGDNTAHTDPAYFTDYVKAAVATFALDTGCLITSGLGAVDGHVRAASGGDPIADALVEVSDEAGHTYPVHTDPGGYYTRTLQAGTYDLTASAYGFLPETITGVVVVTDTVTTQDFALDTAPFYTVAGQVTEAGTGIPLFAEIEFAGSPVTTWTDPVDGSYEASLPPGDYTMKVSAASHHSEERSIVVQDANQVQDFSLTPLPCLLLVDDDQNGPDVRNHYTTALDAIGMDYEVWDVISLGSPEEADLAGYTMLLWFTGYPWDGTFTNANEAAVSAYLDAGGKFFLSSQDYLYDTGLTSFGQNYLHIGSYVNDVTQTTVNGQNVFNGLGIYYLSYPYSNYSDRVNPDIEAQVAFTGTQQSAAITHDGEIFQTVFFGFPFEAIPAGGRVAVMDRLVEFFGDCACDPVAGTDFSFTPPDPWAGEMVTFSGTVALGTPPITYLWDFGDSSAGTGQFAAHAFAAGGTYSVTLTAANACSLEQITHPVTVFAPCDPPSAAFAWQPLEPITGEEVIFTSLVTGTEPLSLTWDFGDGITGTGAIAAHTFGSPGTYTVILQAENECGEAVVQHLVTVFEPPCEAPVAAFSFAPAEPFVSETITFTASTTGTEPVEFAWSFGDALTGTGAIATHAYAEAGGYTVTLTADNACGTAMIQHPILVHEPIPPCDPPGGVDFAWSPIQPTIDDQVILVATVMTGTLPFEYLWTFSDGPYTATAPLVIRYFPIAGTYTVTLHVENECGFEEVTREVVVLETRPLIYDAYLPLIWREAGP